MCLAYTFTVAFLTHCIPNQKHKLYFILLNSAFKQRRVLINPKQVYIPIDTTIVTNSFCKCTQSSSFTCLCHEWAHVSRAPFFPNVFTIYNNVIDERIRYSFFCFYACRITCTYSLSDVMSFCIYAWEATICFAYCKLQHVSLCSFSIIGVCMRILRIYMHAYMSVMRTISMCTCWVVCHVHSSYTCL